MLQSELLSSNRRDQQGAAAQHNLIETTLFPKTPQNVFFSLGNQVICAEM